MDKFGIFNLLNSFLNFYNQSKGEPPSENAEPKNPLEQLFSINKTDSVNPQKKEPPKTTTAYRPLQSEMLKTISNHDDIIKRAKLNARKNNPL